MTSVHGGRSLRFASAVYITGRGPLHLLRLTLTMSTVEFIPSQFPDDGSTADAQLLKNDVTLTSITTTHAPLAGADEDAAFEDDVARTFIVELTVHDEDPDEPQRDGKKGTLAATHDGDDDYLPPSSLAPPEKTHPPLPITITTSGAPSATDDRDSDGLCTPIEPPGLSKPDDTTPVQNEDQTSCIFQNADAACAAVVSKSSEPTPTEPSNDICDISPKPSARDFSLHGLQSLRSFIPDDLLPDDLLVYDRENITKLCDEPDVPVRYVRIFPELPREGDTPDGAHEGTPPPGPKRIAHLYLTIVNKLEHSTVRVAAKTAFSVCGAHDMLDREAQAYDAFPRYLMEDRPGEPAAVPKFFGYYAAAEADGSVIEKCHPSCNEDDTCPVQWPTHILLVEECGVPIIPCHYTRKQRESCLELVERLHAAGFYQGSIYVRNILVEAGPLSVPPAERSHETPSFRIIDFGRRVMMSQQNKSRFRNWCADEIRRTKHELALS
ncbi:hypothetical protein BD309DRAFT_524665 [Dichomitus squalens]|nr:hypothetical protein BD309DRAFT_524665 [Dichomitus squalens]